MLRSVHTRAPRSICSEGSYANCRVPESDTSVKATPTLGVFLYFCTFLPQRRHGQVPGQKKFLDVFAAGRRGRPFGPARRFGAFRGHHQHTPTHKQSRHRRGVHRGFFSFDCSGEEVEMPNARDENAILGGFCRHRHHHRSQTTERRGSRRPRLKQVTDGARAAHLKFFSGELGCDAGGI